MRLVLPDTPGVFFEVDPAVPFPADPSAWHKTVLGAATIARVERTNTKAGWAVVLIETESASLYAFFELYDRGVAVRTVANDLARAALLAGDIDRSPRDVVALAQLWDEAHTMEDHGERTR